MPSIPPSSWRLVTLDDVAAPVPNAIVDGPFGSNLKLDDYLDDYVDEGVPVLQGKNITNDNFRWFDVRFISTRKAEELKRSSVRVGDILIVKIGSIGYAAIIDDLRGFDYAIIPANLAKVTPDIGKVDLRYLHRWLTSTDAKQYFVRVSSKTAQPALSLGKIRRLPVPLPPLPEQQRIAEILDKADALRTKRRAALAQLDTLTQSIFLDMFGDPKSNSKAWPQKAMAELFASSPIFGTMIPPVTEKRGWLSLRVGNIQDWKLDLSDQKYVDLPSVSVERHSVKDGDLLMARAIASQDHLGKCVIVHPNGEQWALRKLVRTVLQQLFDFQEMSQRSLGANARRYKDRLGEFTPLFVDFLEHTYMGTLEKNGDAKIQYVREIIDGENVQINTKTKLKDGSEYSVDYKLYLSPVGWRVYDVIVEGISLVNNYRSQFDRVLNKKSFDALLQGLREKKERFN
jgi:type I restriction enzyme, S subunit